MDWTKIAIYQLTALVTIGTLYSFMQFQPQTKQFKILDISQQKTKDDTFVFALVQKAKE